MHFWGGAGGGDGGDGGGVGGDGGVAAIRNATRSGQGEASQPVCDASVEHSVHEELRFAAHKVS